LIDIQSSQRVNQNFDTAATSEKKEVKKASAGTEKVEISARSREIDRLKQELSALPEVRSDRVALAKQLLQQGTYHPDSSVVAQKLMDSSKR
jgi:flagellar biosynthesis anti-sigma factor FlgM